MDLGFQPMMYLANEAGSRVPKGAAVSPSIRRRFLGRVIFFAFFFVLRASADKVSRCRYYEAQTIDTTLHLGPDSVTGIARRHEYSAAHRDL